MRVENMSTTQLKIRKNFLEQVLEYDAERTRELEEQLETHRAASASRAREVKQISSAIRNRAKGMN